MGVLGLSVLGQHARRDLRRPLHQLEDGAILDLGARLSKVHEGVKTGIGLAEHGVAVSGDDLSRLENVPEICLDVLGAERVSDLALHGLDEAEDLLGGETVEGSCESLQSGGVGEEGVGEG